MDPDTYLSVMKHFTAIAPTLQDVKGIKEAIENTFEEHGLSEIIEKIILICSNGASVNSGENSGLPQLFQDNFPYGSFVWCVCHWLE